MSESSGQYEPSSRQTNITVSDRVLADYQIVAEYQQTARGTMLRQILETHWASPSFQALLKTAKAARGKDDS